MTATAPYVKKGSASRITNANSAILQSACFVTNQVAAVTIAKKASSFSIKRVHVRNAKLGAMAVKIRSPASIVILLSTLSDNLVTISVSAIITEDGTI